VDRARPEREAGRVRRCIPWRRLGRAWAVAQRVMRVCKGPSPRLPRVRHAYAAVFSHSSEVRATTHNSHPVQGQEGVL
jgi:hypothetical protein